MGWLSSASLALGAWTPLANNPNGVAGGGSTRPIVSQLRFLGANGSTTFTDDARPTRVWTANANAKISTDLSAAAGVSGMFVSGSDRITTPYTQDLSVVGVNRIFCVEGFFKVSALASGTLFGQWTNTGGSTINRRSYILAVVVTGSVLRLSAGIVDQFGNAVDSDDSSNSVAVDEWAHAAFYHPVAGTQYYLALKGVVTPIYASLYIATDSGVVTQQIGATDDTTFTLNGRLQGFRFWQGSCPYGASNFTPPSPPFPAI